jgi:hypothetical protein
MITAHVKERTPKERIPRTLFPGIQQAAREFGFSRVLLYRVLKGQLPDHHNLCRRYKTWIAAQQKAGA